MNPGNLALAKMGQGRSRTFIGPAGLLFCPGGPFFIAPLRTLILYERATNGHGFISGTQTRLMIISDIGK